jgi:LPS-assembly protein
METRDGKRGGMSAQGGGIVAAFCLFCLTALAPAPAPGEELPRKIPISVTADKLDYDRTNDVYTAVGHVRIEQEGLRMEADKVVFNNRTGLAVAEGHAYLRDKGDTLTADRLEININTRAGIIYNGELFMSKDNFHFRGDRIERRSENVYRVENGTFTTCDEGEWYLQAREIDVDLDRYATGSGVAFKMAGLPVFYTPYLLFPVRRQSGLLIPELGFSSNDGFLMKNAFFWAISDHRDMTLTSDYRGRTGHGTGVEYRYANSRDSAGRASYTYFDTFDSGVTRWELLFQHREEFAEDLSFRADATLVSDENYYRDLEKKLELRSRPYVDSNAFYVERWNTAALNLLGQYSTDLTQSNENTIQKLPELRYAIFSERLGGPLHLNFEGSAANFTSQEGDNVRRADFKPELRAALSGRSLSFTPRAGGRVTYYDRGASTIEPTDRKYYFAGADLNARLSRVYGTDRESGIGRVRHSIEPAVAYSYIPKIDQGDIPLLDSVEDLNEIKEKNLVTVSLINRLTARYRDSAGFRTFDLLVFRLSQDYDVNEARNTPAEARPRSELRGELYVKTPRILTVSAKGTYDTYTERLLSSTESMSFKGETLQFDLSHRYLRATATNPKTQFLIIGMGVPAGKWKLNGQVWQDVENHATTQQEYKAHYGSQCWGLGVSYVTKPGETQFLFSLDLKGLGAVKF